MKCNICNEEAFSIIRKISVCRKCFGILQNDNIKRINKGIDIFNNSKILKKCFRYKCRNFFESEIKYTGEELINEFCSKECKELNKLIKVKETKRFIKVGMLVN